MEKSFHIDKKEFKIKHFIINKEKIYEEYLTSEMHESDLIIKLDLIQEKAFKSGIIYTPWNIVQEMISIAKPTPEMNIIEPSCGRGVFLIGLLSYMSEKHHIVGQNLIVGSLKGYVVLKFLKELLLI